MFKNLLTLAKRYRFLIIAALVGALGAVYYFLFAMPDANASSYMDKTRAALGPVAAAFEEVTATADQKLFYDPDLPPAEKYDQAVKMQESSSKAITELNKLRTEANQAFGFGLGVKNRDAAFLQSRLHQTISECQDILNEYSKASDFLMAYYRFQADMQPLLDAGRWPLNPLSVASNLRNRSAQIGQMSVPSEFGEIKNQTIDHVNAVASVLESGDRSLTQSVGEAGRYLNNEVFRLTADNSYTITNVKSMHDKLSNLQL